MDVREKLVEIIQNSVGGCARHWAEVIADGLIAHGVTVRDNAEITDELLKQLRNAPPMVLHEEPTIEVVQEWISVKDRLPENDTRVLVYLNIEKLDAYTYTIFDTDRMLDGKWIRWNTYITHWMPLPQPPKGE